MDFMLTLPKNNGFNILFIIINKFIKQVLFIIKKIT